MKASVDTSRLEAFLRQVDKTARGWADYRGEIACRATAERSGEENARIFEEQTAEGRDPLFLADGERRQAAVRLEDAAAKTIESGSDGMRPAVDAVVRMFVGWIKDHISAGKSEHGRMRRLSEKQEKYKRRHFPGKPILVRTGQLLASLYSRVARG